MSNVVANTQDESSYGPPRTVQTIVEIKTFLVEFYDADGKYHRDIVQRLGEHGPLVGSRQGPAMCAAMGTLNGWLESSIKARLDAKRVLNVPKEDDVRVTEDAPITVGKPTR